MRERQRPYLAYLLRLWQVHHEREIGWRASVENAHTGEKVGFAHLDELVAFLRERTGLAPPAERAVKEECIPKVGSEPEEI
jgi:hypothetical protein